MITSAHKVMSLYEASPLV